MKRYSNLIITITIPFMVYLWLLLFCAMIAVSSSFTVQTLVESPLYWVFFIVLTIFGYGIRWDLKDKTLNQNTVAKYEVK